MPHLGLLLTSVALKWVIGVACVVIWVWAEVRALMRGQMLWLVVISLTGPFGALAYFAGTVAGDRARSGYGGGSSQWPPPRR